MKLFLDVWNQTEWYDVEQIMVYFITYYTFQKHLRNIWSLIITGYRF